MICKKCKKEFEPLYRNGILISKYCIACQNSNKKVLHGSIALKQKNKPLNRTKIEIPKKSQKQIDRDYLCEKSKERLISENPLCRICHTNKGTELMHILNKGSYPEYYTFTQNHTLGCHECHSKFDDYVEFRKQQELS